MTLLLLFNQAQIRRVVQVVHPVVKSLAWRLLDQSLSDVLAGDRPVISFNDLAYRLTLEVC